MLYKNFKEKQDRMVLKRAEIEHERMKDCSFHPKRESIKGGGQRFMETTIDQFERVYKFNVDSVLKKYQQQPSQ
jgi:hypothetical protein